MATRRERDNRQRRYANAKEIAERDMSGSERDTLTLPKGVNVFDFKKEGTYRLDVLPYEVGEGNPKADAGMFHYERRYYAHRRIGPNKESYVCLAKTFKKRCPVCEYLSKGEVSEDEYKDLKAKERQMIPVVDLEDKQKRVQIYEGPFYNGLGELIAQELEIAEGDDPVVDFYHPDKGVSFKILVRHESVGTGKFFKPVKISLMPRKEGYTDDFLDGVPCLDTLIKTPTYAELQEIVDGITGGGDDEVATTRASTHSSNGDDEDEEEMPRRPTKRAAKVEDEETEGHSDFEVESEVIHDKYGECTIVKIHAGGSLDIEDENGKTHKNVDAGDVELAESGTQESDEDEEAPRKSARAPAEEEDEEDSDDDDLDEDEIDEEEATTKRKGKGRR